jgi:1-phosphatidylinositol-4-phosphate 5-kinase
VGRNDCTDVVWRIFKQHCIALQVFSGKNDKVGEIINSEHRSYELMLDLQLGVRWSVSKISPTPAPQNGLKSEHFTQKVKVDFPRVGSRETPPHPNGDFRWKDYCPMLFRKLRSLFVVDPGEYMLSICGEQALRELSSPGKSGALFYISHDDRFLIKTMRRNEMKTFLKMLPEYYEHIQSNPHTLVTKFYGLYRIQMHGRKVCTIRTMLSLVAN